VIGPPFNPMPDEETVKNLKGIALDRSATSQEQIRAIDILGDLGAKDALSEVAAKSRNLREYALITLKQKLLADEIQKELVER